MNRRLLFFTLFIALPYALFAQNTAVISGIVKDSEGNPVDLASVFVRSQNVGTITDANGLYSLGLEPGDDLLLEVNHTAFAPQSKTIDVESGDSLWVSFRMQLIEIEGVEINADREQNLIMKPVPIKDLKINPTVQQGIESVLTSQLGVHSNNELSSSYSVRGGSYAENLVYVNDIEVYRPILAHSGRQEGLSFANPDMVGKITFSAGGFAARYGDKMSSVLDIHYKKPEHFGGSVSASLLGGSASLETASKDRKLTQISGFRYQTNQYILGSLDTQGDYQPNFTDFQTYWTYNLSQKWEVAFLGNYSRNIYKFVPVTRQTNFGSINEALRLTVFFEGQEVTSYETLFGALSTDFRPNSDTRLKFTVSGYQNYERETFDVLGQYFLDELERDFGDDDFGNVVRNRGIGGYLEHARNRVNASVINFQHRGFKSIANKYLQWGATWRVENIEDHLSEWNYVDSAGFSIPINPPNKIVLQDVVKGHHTIHSNRLMAYVQNRWNWLLDNEDEITSTIGVRAQYWDFNGQTVVSPRGAIAWKPHWTRQINDSTILNRNVVFRFSTGYYYQPPYYHELIRPDGTLNAEVRAQRAIHFVLGADINFKMWNRPFIFITEAYYKALSNLVPYEIDNVRLIYLGKNKSEGYATGLDLKIHGDFIPGIESWANLSFLSTKEDIIGDYYYKYYNSDGTLIQTGYTANNVAVDSTRVTPGYIPRPNDQLIYFSMFFQDEMPSFPKFKVHLSVQFGTGLPFGPPDLERYKDVERLPAYRRVDIGFSYDLIPDTPGKGLFGKFNSAIVSLEVWNLFDISNTIGYTWIKESSGRLYGVPNYLTTRRVNLKFAFTF